MLKDKGRELNECERIISLEEVVELDECFSVAKKLSKEKDSEVVSTKRTGERLPSPCG
jgi:hypothetical protein